MVWIKFIKFIVLSIFNLLSDIGKIIEHIPNILIYIVLIIISFLNKWVSLFLMICLLCYNYKRGKIRKFVDL